MGPNDLKELLKQRPFKAFRIYLTNGLELEIRHPDQCFVGKRAVRIVLSRESTLPEHLRGKTVLFSLLHITHIVELD